MNQKKKCVCVTLSVPFLDAFDCLLEADVYVSRADIFKDALRRLFRHYELLPFVADEVQKER